MSIFKKFLKEMAEDAEKEIHNFLDKLEAETNSQSSSSTDDNQNVQNNSGSHFYDSYSNQSHDDEETPVRDKPGSKCSACGQYTVYHAGTDFLHGNPMTGASDCEVSHIYKCDNCGHQYESHY